jgi:acetate---CoA ligase (ADP-forming)
MHHSPKSCVFTAFRVKYNPYMDTNELAPFFSPKGVAVVGASQNPVKLSYGLARNLLQSNYPGVVHFVNPKGGSLWGRPMYPNLLEVPDPVDLAILLIPAKFVPQTIEECGKRGIPGVIIGSGGFRETGPEGARLEEECVRVARHYGLRLMGPNCIGLLDTHFPIDATFLPPPGPTPGDVAFISHSGAICAAVIDWARGQGFGLSRLVSLGNQADVTETDVLAPVAADRFTRVLALYLEGVSDGRRFVQEASKVARQKPVIALKVGRFSSGQKAVASHTGALAGEENAYNAAFQKAGVIRADTSEEMFDWARALAWCPLPEGRSMAVLTNAGGPGVTASDALEVNGLKLAALSDETRKALESVLPPAASLSNPVDMLASASPEDYAKSLHILLSDPGVHGVLVILPPPPMYTAGAVARTIIPIIHSSDKPVVIALMGERLIQEAVEHFRAARVPEYRFPERAASALAILVQRAESLQNQLPNNIQNVYEAPSGVDRSQVEAVLQENRGSMPGFLSGEAAGAVLSAYGLPVLPLRLAKSAEEAGIVAEEMGGPVVLKVASAHIPHKTDVGGVLVGVEGKRAAQEGFEAIVSLARKALPEAVIDGVYLQKLAPPGQEVILGTVQDPQFGPLVMFGAGGVEVEALKDVHFGLAPLDTFNAEWLVENTWAGRRLRGFRRLPAADREAVLDALIRLSHLAYDFPQLSEIEINPLRVMPEGEGAWAIDVRIKINPSGEP